MKYRYRVFNNVINSCFDYFISILMIILLTVVFSAVVFRYILLSPIPWSFEVARYLNIWLVFFGMYYLEKDDEFLKVDFVSSFFKGNMLKFIALVIKFLTIVIGFLLVFNGFIFVYKITGQRTAALGIPMGIAYLSCPVGISIMLIVSFKKLIIILKSIFRK